MNERTETSTADIRALLWSAIARTLAQNLAKEDAGGNRDCEHEIWKRIMLDDGDPKTTVCLDCVAVLMAENLNSKINEAQRKAWSAGVYSGIQKAGSAVTDAILDLRKSLQDTTKQ